MNDPALHQYVQDLMLKEIGPAILDKDISASDIDLFAASVIERFRNPFLEHQWIAITAQYSSKMKMRNLPLILAHYKKWDTVPELMAKGFAAFILFMRGSEKTPYPVKDDHAGWFNEKWNKHGIEGITEAILSDTDFWGVNLSTLPGFSEAVKEWLLAMENEGVKNILNKGLRTNPIIV